MASPVRPEDFYAFGAETLQRVFEEQEQTAALGLNDLLPDVPQTNDRMAWKAWDRECKRGPVTVAGMLEAYRRGVQAGLEDAEDECNRLKGALSDLLYLCENANAGAFRNGVTDNSNTMDEGEVIAWRFMDNARTLIKEADQ
jgi:hypothetical protein